MEIVGFNLEKNVLVLSLVYDEVALLFSFPENFLILFVCQIFKKIIFPKIHWNNKEKRYFTFSLKEYEETIIVTLYISL